MQRADLLTRLLATGLDTFAPEPPTVATALKRALKEWVKARGIHSSQGDEDDEAPASHGGRAVRDLVRPIDTRRSTHVVFTLVGENADFAQLGLSYGTQARILCNPSFCIAPPRLLRPSPPPR